MRRFISRLFFWLSASLIIAFPQQCPAGQSVPAFLAYCGRVGDYWQVCVSDLEGKAIRILTHDAVDKRYPAVSPDGKTIAYCTNTSELWVCGADGGNARKIALPIPCSQPVWNPDGKSIAFVSIRDLYHGSCNLWQVEIDTGKLKKLTRRPWLQYDPCFSPDGKKLVFTDGPELFMQEIRKLDLATGDVTQVTDNGMYQYDTQARFSPDGSRIVYSSNETGAYDIWISDAFGMNKRNLTNDAANDSMPYFCGEWIYFLSDRRGTVQVWRMTGEGGEPTMVSEDTGEKQDLTVFSG